MRYLTKWIFMRFSLPLGDPPSEILPSTCNTATTQHYTKHRWSDCRELNYNSKVVKQLQKNLRNYTFQDMPLVRCNMTNIIFANSKVSDQIYIYGSSVSVSTRNKCRYIKSYQKERFQIFKTFKQ